MSIHLAFFLSLISLFLFYHSFTIMMDDLLFETVKGRVSGVLAVIFLIIILVCKHQLS